MNSIASSSSSSHIEERGEAVAVAASVAALGLLTLVTRLPFRTHYLMNWDAVQFALGIRHFDIVHHQPHPPGYIGYVAIGRLLMPLFGNDINATLIAVSIAGEIAGVVLVFLFARSLFGTRAGWAAGLALVLAPLFWYYGEVANTYALEPALVLAIAWPCWRLWTGDVEAASPAALALGLAGAIRPSTTALLGPLFAFALMRSGAPRALKIRAAALLAAAIAVWLLPLFVIAGGPLPVLTASLELGGSVTAGTALWNDALNPVRVGLNAVMTGVGWELGVLLVFIIFGFAVAPRLGISVPMHPPNSRGRVTVRDSFGLFCAAWAAPSLLIFVFVHIGQVAYVQTFTPLLFLVVGPALEATASALGRPWLGPWLLFIGLAVEVVIFFTPAHSSLAGDLRLHDQRVASMVKLVAAYDPARTVLVTDAGAAGSYRTAQVYLPDYSRVAIGGDERGHAGEIYGDVYQPWRFAREEPPEWPANANTYIVLDPEVVRRAPDRDRLRRVALADGSHVLVWQGPAPVMVGSQLWFDHPGWVRTAGRRI